jgi:hypothetical protein
VGYAFGFRLIGVTFWRFYAVIFSFEINLRFVRVILEPSSPRPAWLVAVVWLAVAMMCVALLRHAELMGGRVQPAGLQSPIVRSRPAAPAGAPPARLISARVGVDAQRLNYRRTTLLGTGVLALALGSVVLLTILGPLADRRGLVLRLLVTVLGEDGARICLAAMGVLACAGGLRLLWLLGRGALAIQFDSAGIAARAIFGSLRIPWSSVKSMEMVAVATTRGPQRVLVVRQSGDASLLLRLVGLRDKIAIPRNLLDAQDAVIDAWLEAARGRAGSQHLSQMTPRPGRSGGFGRKQ